MTHLATLERRAEWLKKRLNEAAAQGRNLTHDQRELEALRWALARCSSLTDAEPTISVGDAQAEAQT